MNTLQSCKTNASAPSASMRGIYNELRLNSFCICSVNYKKPDRLLVVKRKIELSLFFPDSAETPVSAIGRRELLWGKYRRGFFNIFMTECQTFPSHRSMSVSSLHRLKDNRQRFPDDLAYNPCGPSGGNLQKQKSPARKRGSFYLPVLRGATSLEPSSWSDQSSLWSGDRSRCR
jgi:hypothetical protein